MLTEMSELTDMELDIVCGGLLDFGNTVVQANTAVQVGLGFGGSGDLSGNLTQLLGQANLSGI